MNNGMASAMVILCGRYIGGGEEEAYIRSISCQTEPTVVTMPANQYTFLQNRHFCIFSPEFDRKLRQFPERKVQEVFNVCCSPGHDVAGIEGGAI